ncbi:Lrp/AsnC family transcriptional regulator [Pelosinus baikalensis]|uniref:Lrp/AsnC family transcriptional regulator n=1 Tax=Pelosinus baikalensis TaxID=2892015 RepID=A0ABS8HXQ3_9FIRM|nr:Lrp/AsnC family transcriptional regulator [Pelosinus baikalensis]MCC5467946.1 Lrp/AsnC family transcriptional regulator [Pelosinus baikalensis]
MTLLDSTDLEIVKCLRENGRMLWKDIGAKVHLTGQAVADRVHRLEDLGVLKGYSVILDDDLLGISQIALITIFLKSGRHADFRTFIKNKEEVCEAHRISGDGCYWLKAKLTSQAQLNKLLDEINEFGGYRLCLSVNNFK